ncbi:cilia and flagella-associated protein 47-like isoform X2 [Anthonomus grandis grandis]|uniref:cilia and flagella-associated protein 47-like isoform X2 n=1 Tax=Anthonomus grandis grandis TaxID=2921223 RepID=UPI002164F7AF|nr:cilia and flagella-associated protein 47-like isoform X2 [Anthonomus grandis grandis]
MCDIIRSVSSYSWIACMQEQSSTIPTKIITKPLIVNGVQIDPEEMYFRDAYDGKMFNQVLKITNLRKNSVNIRIGPPSSKAFRFKPILIGKVLSAGLSITKRIKLLYATPTAVPQASMDIYIDNECIRYKLIVIPCFAQISVSPRILDYGEIDVGMVSDKKKIMIQNSGTKQSHFSIDLGRNPLNLMVEPTRGTVQPGDTKCVTVEIFGTCEGEFHQEFWIKTDPLQKVNVQGRFIEPMLDIEYPFSNKNMLILNFPNTFVGVKLHRNVIIQNHSSTSAVFCVNGRVKLNKYPYKQAEEHDYNLRQFEITPLEGRLIRDYRFILNIKFCPQKPKNKLGYYMCNAIVDVKKFQTSEASIIAENRFNENQSQVLESISVTTIDPESNQESGMDLLGDSLTMILYGETELPDITIVPSKLNLLNLILYKSTEEPVQFINNSKSLPLILQFTKVANIDFDPVTFVLPPKEIVQATLTVKPTAIGDAKTRVAFDVLFQQKQTFIKLKTIYLPVLYTVTYEREYKGNQQRKPGFLPGIVPKNHNEVGYLVEDVRFNTNMKMPKTAIIDEKLVVFNKNNDALIAFPNDRPKVLRPWKNPIPCKTIFTQLPRLITPVDVDYDLTPEQQRLKDTKDSYYLNYIRNLSKKKPLLTLESLDDYETTNKKRLLLEYKYKNKDCQSQTKKQEHNLFIPLTPYELQKVIVSAPFIQLGRLAAFTECSDQFTIENKNEMAVHILVKPKYRSISIIDHEFILEANSQHTVEFIFHSEPGGTYHIPVFIHINFFHVLVVTVLATIVANTVQCVTKNINIIPTEKTAILELRNPINSDVGFTIDTAFFHLEAFPRTGVIPSKRNMAITITFNPTVGYSPVKEISVISESGCKELIEVRFSHKKANVQVSNETLTFKDIPLNTPITQELVVFNRSDQLVTLTIEYEQDFSVPELTINPSKAIILQKGDVTLAVTVLFKEIVEFTIPVKLILQSEYEKDITIKGNVVSSLISFKPDLLKIPKIPSGATLSIPFKIMNTGDIASLVTFQLQDYPEFDIKTRAGECITDKSLNLASKERRDLYLEFHPQEPVVYCIYLPYMLNNFFGPVELNVKESVLCDTYMRKEESPYKSRISRPVSEKLKTLKILCTAGSRWLKFSDLEFQFETPKKVLDEFVIENVSGTSQEIWFKLEDLEPFQIITDCKDETVQNNLLKRFMEPNESWSLNIRFVPEVYGTFAEEVPIFVKDHSETKPFNHLTLNGKNLKPRTISDVNSIYFIPSKYGIKQFRTITLDLLGHTCNHAIMLEHNHSEIEFSLKGQEHNESKSVFRYVVKFAPTKDCFIETSIIFSCPCSVKTKVKIYASADKAAVVNFMSESSIIKDSTYPYFPIEEDKSPYAEMLRNLVSIMERWIFTQGFFYTNYYIIPDTIARYPVEASEEKPAAGPLGKKEYPNLPLVQLLINLINKSIMKYIDNNLMPSKDPQNKALFCYVTYRNAISFMKSQGIRVAGLKPQHLLTFADYTEYKNGFKSEEDDEDFGQEEFSRFSKQRWMDLCFTIYKVLVQIRILYPKNDLMSCNAAGETNFIKQDSKEFHQYYNDNINRFPKLLDCDAKIVLWLEYHYNRQRQLLWPNEKFKNPTLFKSFFNLGKSCSICFSVALGTLTLAYCPYLIDFLNDMYAFPKTLEQNMHNACRVTQAWKILKLSFEVHPQTLVDAKIIKIIFIVNYLYEVLPHFYPINEVSVEAPLSQSAVCSLAIQNCGEIPVSYSAFFYGEDESLFELESQSLNIPPKKSKNLNLTFFAKKVLKASIILVLSGETTGHQYAQSQAVSITGMPQTSSSDEIKLMVETYKWTRQKIPIKTPYGRKNYVAKIYYCLEQPKSYADMHSFASLQQNYIPREIDILNGECEFSDKGQADIILRTCFLSHGVMRFYLYFCNETVGDFCVLVTIIANTNKNKAEIITINLKNRDFKEPCTCKRGFNYNCPKMLLSYIPCKNLAFWNCTKNMITKFLTPGIVKIFEKYFDTPIVFRLMRFYLERYPQGFMLPSIIYEDKAEFNINLPEGYSSPSPTLTINDVFSEEQLVPLVVHWNGTGRPKELLVELMNVNNMEVRYYNLIFRDDPETRQNIRESKGSNFHVSYSSKEDSKSGDENKT